MPSTEPHPSTDRARPSFDQPPYPPPSSPPPPVPKGPPTSQRLPSPPQQPLPPTPDSLRPARHSSRRKRTSSSPSQEIAQFQRELAQSQRRTSPDRHFAPDRRFARFTPASTTPPRQLNQPPDPDMHMSTLSTSSTSSLVLSKPPIPSPGTTAVGSPPSGQQRHHRPNTVYFHGGIGGAGNYRKVIRENNRAPRAYAENAEPVGRRPSSTSFLSSLFGSQRGRRGGRTGGGGGGVAVGHGIMEERVSGTEDSHREEVSLGAAEIMRRKLVGGGWRKKGS
ncbi:MAG: hypothetical protein Q9217_001820 [Psora testacea]